MSKPTNWALTPESSNVVGYGYFDKVRELVVEFKGGRTYAYSNVPKNIFRGLQQADSKGAFISENIKGTYTARPL